MLKRHIYISSILLLIGLSLIVQADDDEDNSKRFHYEMMPQFESDGNGMLKTPGIVYPTPKTTHKRKKLYGSRKDRYEVPEDKMIPGCGYSPGFREPCICTDDKGNVIYKRGWDKKILEDLQWKHDLKMKAYRAGQAILSN
jgi:hypothetical protein